MTDPKTRHIPMSTVEAPPRKRSSRLFWLLKMLVAAIVTVLMASLVLTFLIMLTYRPGGHRQYTACKSNLHHITVGLEMYSTDWSGLYPDSLAKLTPNYLKTIPECPANSSDTYSSSYSLEAVEGEPEAIVFWVGCSAGHEEVEVPPGYPRYHSAEGVIENE